MLRRDGDRDADPFLKRASRWAADLELADVPEGVRRAAVAQVFSTLGAAVWTLDLPVSDRISRAVEAEYGAGGDATFLAGGSLPPRAAAYGNAALSLAVDYDDSVFGAHAGHSAVLVPVAYAEATGASGQRALKAAIAATEVAARLGSATALGPLRGQRAAHVHAVATAVGRGVVEGDDAETIADAAALALARPSWPLEAARFTDAKVTTAAEPIERGCHAVAEARAGADANRDIVESPGGFLETFADHPLPELLDSLGERWHTCTVTVKPHPGSSHVIAPVEAALDAREQLGDRTSVGIDRVRVAGPLFAVQADARASEHVDGPDSALAALNASVAYNVAVALREGRHTPREFRYSRVADERVWRLAERVEVEHDPRFTRAVLEAEVPLGIPLRRLGPGVLSYAVRLLGPATALGLFPTLVRHVRRRSLPEDLSAAAERPGARVTLELADGAGVSATCEHPTGFAGRPLVERRGIARRKFRRALHAAGREEAEASAACEAVATLADAATVSLAEFADVG